MATIEVKKENKFVRFVKDHKTSILLGAVTVITVAGGIVLVALGKKKPMTTVEFSGVFSTPKSRDIEVSDWGVGELAECWRESGWINLIAKDFTVADAGKFGEELLKIDGVTEDTVLQTVMAFEDTLVT